MTEFITKYSGIREEFSTGMKRDTQENKPRFDLLFINNMPFKEQMFTRYAMLRERGAQKYSARNCELACTQEELDRYLSSGARHFAQWLCGETDEDHASAVIFNIQMAEMVRWKLKK